MGPEPWGSTALRIDQADPAAPHTPPSSLLSRSRPIASRLQSGALSLWGAPRDSLRPSSQSEGCGLWSCGLGGPVGRRVVSFWLDPDRPVVRWSPAIFDADDRSPPLLLLLLWLLCGHAFEKERDAAAPPPARTPQAMVCVLTGTNTHAFQHLHRWRRAAEAPAAGRVWIHTWG